jgi:hypothetical protein
VPLCTWQETAKLAGECAIIRRAVALARWVGAGGEGADQGGGAAQAGGAGCLRGHRDTAAGAVPVSGGHPGPVCGEITGGAADDSLGLLVRALALLRSVSAGIRLSSREVIDAAHAIADERGRGADAGARSWRHVRPQPRLEADLPRAISPGATATEAITVVAVARASDR